MRPKVDVLSFEIYCHSNWFIVIEHFGRLVDTPHPLIVLVLTYPAERMKAWRVAKLSGNGPQLLETVLRQNDRWTGELNPETATLICPRYYVDPSFQPPFQASVPAPFQSPCT